MCVGMEWGTEAEAERETRTMWLSRWDTTSIGREVVRTDQSWETSEGGLDNTTRREFRGEKKSDPGGCLGSGKSM